MRRFIQTSIAIAAVCLTLGFMWYSDLEVKPADISWEDVVSEAEAGGYKLISTPELRELQLKADKHLILVDTRQSWEYRTGHMKGALSFPMEPTWLSRWQNKENLEIFLGPDKDQTIVFY